MTPAELRASTIDLLTDAREYFDNLSDAEYDEAGRPVGNPEMSLYGRITELLAEIEAQKPETPDAARVTFLEGVLEEKRLHAEQQAARIRSMEPAVAAGWALEQALSHWLRIYSGKHIESAVDKSMAALAAWDGLVDVPEPMAVRS